MEFPAELRGEVERLLSEENTDKLAKAAEGISARYPSEVVNNFIVSMWDESP